MSVETPPVFIQAGGETAERARRMLAATYGGRGGIVGAGDLAVTQNGTPNMSVNVATGQVVIRGSESTFQGHYVVENRGTLIVPIAAADATNARKDLIVARVQDSAYSGGVNAASIVAVTGTPAASPAEPAAPANSWVLAMVDVPAGSTSVVNARIADRRTQHSGQAGQAAALGGVIVCTSATRPAVTTAGMQIYETDTKRRLTSDGTNWLDYDTTGLLGDNILQSDGTVTSATVVHSITVTVPANLPAFRRLRVRATCFVNTGTGNGPVISIGATSRPINQGTVTADMELTVYDTSLTPGNRTYQLTIAPSVAGQTVTWRRPQLNVEIV